MIDPVLQQKIKELREYYYDSGDGLRWIEGIEKNIKDLAIKEKLMENASVRAIVEDAHKRIDVIDKMLSNDEEMTQERRAKLFRDKYVHQFYLDRLEGTEITRRRETILKQMDEELEGIRKSTGR